MATAAEISSRLNNLFKPGGEGYQALSGALDKTCIFIEGEAKKKVPVRDGNLRNSITHVVKMEEFTGYVGTNVPYAPYVEIGTGIYSSRGDGRQTPWVYFDEKLGKKVFTRGSHPHPYLKPAMDENLSAIERYFEGIL